MPGLPDPPDLSVAGQRHRRVVEFIKNSGIPFRLVSHAPCRSSVESAAARAAAGASTDLGAKALVLRTSGTKGFVMAVVPGTHRLQSDRMRALVGKFRFATPGEVVGVTEGLEPGTIPPFGAPLFPRIGTVVVDGSIRRAALIGFNAAHLERSVVTAGADYAGAVQNAVEADISEPAVDRA